jgi:hypothetical protein
LPNPAHYDEEVKYDDGPKDHINDSDLLNDMDIIDANELELLFGGGVQSSRDTPEALEESEQETPSVVSSPKTAPARLAGHITVPDVNSSPPLPLQSSPSRSSKPNPAATTPLGHQDGLLQAAVNPESGSGVEKDVSALPVNKAAALHDSSPLPKPSTPPRVTTSPRVTTPCPETTPNHIATKSAAPVAFLPPTTATPPVIVPDPITMPRPAAAMSPAAATPIAAATPPLPVTATLSATVTPTTATPPRIITPDQPDPAQIIAKSGRPQRSLKRSRRAEDADEAKAASQKRRRK